MITIPTMADDDRIFYTEKKPCAKCGRVIAHRARDGVAVRHTKKPGVPCVADEDFGDPNERAPNRALRAAVLKRDGHRCKKCRTSQALELHHVHEWYLGGRTTIDNLHTLCARCHAEWTWSPPPSIGYDEWLTMPPADRVIMILAGIKRGDIDISMSSARQLFDGIMSARVRPEDIE